MFKEKKFLILFLLIGLILSISAVSASDIDNNSADDNILKNNTDLNTSTDLINNTQVINDTETNNTTPKLELLASVFITFYDRETGENIGPNHVVEIYEKGSNQLVTRDITDNDGCVSFEIGWLGSGDYYAYLPCSKHLVYFDVSWYQTWVNLDIDMW